MVCYMRTGNVNRYAQGVEAASLPVDIMEMGVDVVDSKALARTTRIKIYLCFLSGLWVVNKVVFDGRAWCHYRLFI